MIDPTDLERHVVVFEQQWSAQAPLSIPEYLDGLHLEDPSHRVQILSELICIDIEFRWKAHTNMCTTRIVEDYAALFPELGLPSDIPLILIEEEYRARHLWGDSPKQGCYTERFPRRNGEIGKALCRIDDELIRERATSPTHRTGAGDEFIAHVAQELCPRLEYSNYVLQEMIGSGQMGRVYKALNRKSDATVAVKFLRKAFCRDQSAVLRFLSEARIVQQLQHVGIVRVDGVGETPGGGYFFVMECLNGPDLASVVARGPIDIRDAVKWTRQAAEAIGFSNGAGVVHCDLKPGNLVLDARGNIKITDFGLARSANESSGAVDRIAGTAPYMAPEQVSGWWGSIGPHTDVYALGAVLYCLLTGRAPYVGNTATDILSCIVSGKHPAAPNLLRSSISSNLSSVVTKALSKEPRNRFGSAAEFATALAVASQSVCGEG